MTDIVSSQSVSFDSIKTDLMNYVFSLNDYSKRWKDYYEGGAGQTVLELIAGTATYLNLIALKSRREAYLDEARLSSSVNAIATTVGYDVNRASAPQYSLTIVCTNQISYSKETIIGYYNSIPMSLLQDTTFQIGTNTVTVALGTWNTFSTTSTTSAAFTRFLIQDTVDNNLYNLKINGNLIETVRASELLADNANVVLLRTYFTGMFIIFGDGIFGMPVNVGDQITFEYIVPAPITTDASVNLSNINCNVGVVTAGTAITYGTNRDSDAKIKVVAPGYFTTKRRLITESDYNNVALSYNGIISSNEQKHPGICCTIDLAVLADGGRTLIPSEQTAFLNYMNSHQVLGTTINLVAPQAISVSILLVVVIQKTADTTAIQSLIAQYFNSMFNQLGALFSVRGIFNLELPGAIGVYLKYPMTDYQASYNQYFTLSSLNVQFTTDATSVGSFGTDSSIGYVVNE